MKVAILTSDGREALGLYSSRRPHFGTAPEALLEGFSMFREIEVHVLSCLQKSIESQEKLAGNIYYHSVVVPKYGWLRTGYLGCIYAVRRKLSEIRPDIVHGQGTERDCAMCAVHSGYPNVLTIHGNMRIHAKRAKGFSIYLMLAAFFESVCLKKCNGVIAISNYTKDLVSPLAKKTWLLPNAVNKNFFNLKPRKSGPASILFVGSLNERKNPLGLLRAIAPLLRRNVVELKLAGLGHQGDPYLQELYSAASEFPNVKFLSFLDHKQLLQEFESSTVLVLPTFEDNCPMVVLEAQAAGLPVVASRVGGIPDLIHDGETGLLIDPSDAAHIAQVVEKLLSNPQLQNKLSENERQHAIKTYHPKIIAEEHLKIYNEVLRL